MRKHNGWAVVVNAFHWAERAVDWLFDKFVPWFVAALFVFAVLVGFLSDWLVMLLGLGGMVLLFLGMWALNELYLYAHKKSMEE